MTEPRQLAENASVTADGQGNAYASRSIKKGEVVEESPAIIIPPKGRNSAARATHSELHKSIYSWKDEDDSIAAGMGYLALYGYSSDPNVVVRPDLAKRTLVATARRDLRRGEHLTRAQEFIGRPDDTEPLSDLELGADPPVNKIRIGQGRYGIGVFATENIARNETVEVCPIIYIHPRDRMRASRMNFNHYIFEWDYDKRGTRFHSSALSLGYGGIYNHSSTEDQLKFWQDFENMTLTFYAKKDISKGEEIFHNYGWPDNDARLKG